MLSRHERNRPVRCRLGVQFDLVHGSVRLVRDARSAMLPGQYLWQWLLLQRQLPGRRLKLQHQLKIHLWFVQVWALYLRQCGRAMLPDRHLPDQHWLRNV